MKVLGRLSQEQIVFGLALVLVARRATYPKALMIPYQRGER